MSNRISKKEEANSSDGDKRMRARDIILKSHYLLKRVLGQKIDSNVYWESRYQNGGDSGNGSSGRLAQYKADFVNGFVADKRLMTVLELGCGDGRQLSLARYPSYLGVDVSETAIKLCQKKFAADSTKEFRVAGPFELPSQHKFDLSLSLDVLYHIIKPDQYRVYIQNLFNLSERYVIIYSSFFGQNRSPHVLHRDFRQHVSALAESGQIPDFEIISSPENPFSKEVSFFVYEKADS